MPYLHWEKDRRREIISKFLDKNIQDYRNEKETEERNKKNAMQAFRGDLVIPKYGKMGNQVRWRQDPDSSRLGGNDLSSILIDSRFWKSAPFEMRNGRVVAGTEVGQVLFDAAMLYEAMTVYRDKMLIRKYLHADPPLHPRRTLDLAYYWTSKTMRSQDRNQVVYRTTKPTPEHSINTKTKQWDCPRKIYKPKQPGSAEEQDQADGGHCIHCRRHIRKVPRLLMVDQLWMWILDEETIITAFPNRYGVNKRGSSGLHKAIQSRIEALPQLHIKTVFDLALIILDEAFNIVFDQTKRVVCPRLPEYPQLFDQLTMK